MRKGTPACKSSNGPASGRWSSKVGKGNTKRGIRLSVPLPPAKQDPAAAPPPSPTRDSPGGRPNVRGEGQLLQALVAQHLYEDGQYWTNVRFLYTFQLAFLAAWYAVGPSWLAVTLMGLCCGLTLGLGILCEVVAANRGVNLEAIRVVSWNVLSNETEVHLKNIPGHTYDENTGAIKFATHAFHTRGAPGPLVQRVVFGACILLNAGIGLVTAHDLVSERSWLAVLHSRFDQSRVATETTNEQVVPGDAKPLNR